MRLGRSGVERREREGFGIFKGCRQEGVQGRKGCRAGRGAAAPSTPEVERRPPLVFRVSRMDRAHRENSLSRVWKRVSTSGSE
jgi:hypothetical protein